jgi:hypothetical protein
MMSLGQKVVATVTWVFLSVLVLFFMPLWLAILYFVPAIGGLLLIFRQ